MSLLTFISLFGLISSVILSFTVHKAQSTIDSIISAFIAGSFFYSHVAPYYDHSFALFVIMEAIVICLGALVGVVGNLLLPKISIGIAVGVTLSVFLSVAFFPLIVGQSTMLVASTVLCVGCLVFSVSMTTGHEVLFSCIRTALIVGLIFALSLDSLFFDQALFRTIGYVLRLDVPQSVCYYQCHVPFLLAVWFVVALLSCLIQSHYRGFLRRLSQGLSYQYQPLVSAHTDLKSNAMQRTFSYPDSLVYDYFDPDKPPDSLKQRSTIVFQVVQDLASLHGFQVDSSRNQAEHYLMLLANEAKPGDSPSNSASSRIHTRLFSNYRTWCERMGVHPLFLGERASSEHLSFVGDACLLLLIWGESANLRHMPECLCFLYHKVMEQHLMLLKQSKRDRECKYPGHFLDMVITPIYDVVSSGLKKGTDHVDRKTYDDFNEFFWNSHCMRYEIYEKNQDDLEFAQSENPQSGEGLNHVSRGLSKANKTYSEKRSWLHPLYSMRRVFEWHVLTFVLLAVLGFANLLQWTTPYMTQVGSVVFLIISMFNIIWTLLEVWTLFPQSTIPTPSICGYLIRLFAGYIVLLYQSVYFHWSFLPDSNLVHQHNPFTMDADSSSSVSSSFSSVDQDVAMFWWWQYLWLSIIAFSVYLIECVLCWFPFVVSWLMTSRNEILQSLLNICYPLSQLYVGKNVHVSSYQEVLRYISFWLTLIAFKLWFGYTYIVSPVCVPSMELYDDFMNFQKVSIVKTSLLMFVWWFPHFLVYLIDLSIWYAVWASAVGGFVALVERQGAVRNPSTFRSHFIRAPMAFCQKLMAPTSDVNKGTTNLHISTTSLQNLLPVSKDTHKSGHYQVLDHPTHQLNQPLSKLSRMKASRSSADLQTIFSPSTISTSSTPLNDVESGDREKDGSSKKQDSPVSQKVEEFLDVRSQRWAVFSRVWNEIISHLRGADHLSNQEEEILVFTNFSWLTKPIYLPLYQTAGCIESVVYMFTDAVKDHNNEKEPSKKMLVIEKFHESLDISHQEAVSEAWELISWLLIRLLGNQHSDDLQNVLQVLSSMAESDAIFHRLNISSLQPAINYATNIVGALKSGLNKRKSHPVVTASVRQQYEDSQPEKHVPSGVVHLSSISTSSSSSSTGTGGIKKSVSTGFLPSLMSEDLSPRPEATNKKTTASKFATLQPYRPQQVLTDNLRDKIRDDVRNLLNALRNILRIKSPSPESQKAIDSITFILSLESGFLSKDILASTQIDELAKDNRVMRALNKANGLLKLRQTQVDPTSPEAVRRLHFFMNSLFMDIPSPTCLKYSKEYTCMTPFYSEDVLLTKEDLQERNSDGISTILYLQTLYKKDWGNYLERRGLSDDTQIWSNKHKQETRIWASVRAQTLFRTVEGMMCTEAAIRLIAELENLSTEETNEMAVLKFNYVIACQVYGQMKKNLEHKAEDIEFLLKRHPNLRVAYIDSVRLNREGDMCFYSVLIKHDPIDQTIKEVYRVKLPGNPVLGEGKPENQNHAIIFSRGRYLQAIDMNQDGYFEEALKMRNLLQEFDSGCAILGFREHIFTGSVSSVANYMALQELSFVTLGQRVLCNPLRIRQHYGHPDLFDKFFVMTEGGMSKASKGINLSEDVFAGFNATIRGHSVGFKEYAQVGKGRDVGLQQTYKFEAKLSQGNAEQSLSRDMSRICDRLDFFRLFSFYYGGIGHYMANTMVMFTLVVVVYIMVSLAVYQEEGVNGRPLKPEGILQLILSGMGILQTLPLAVTLTVEKGLLHSISQISYMIISGGPLYFIFHIQTKCYYFSQTLLAGGAMYRPTGRGFVIRHSPFDENFRFFASSHIYLGFELMIALILLAIHTTSKQYGGLTWSLWMTVTSFMLGPFWFNPVTFEWATVQEDYHRWTRWMQETGGASEQSWVSWWKEENSFFKNLSLSWKMFLLIQKCGIWTFVGCGLLGSRILRDPDEKDRAMQVLGMFFIFGMAHWILSLFEKNLSYALRRFSSLTLTTTFLMTVIYLLLSHTLYIKYTIGIYYLLSAGTFMCLLLGLPVAFAYKIHDMLIGHTLFFLLGLLSLLQVGYLQTWLLYHNALSQGVAIDQVLRYARRSRELAEAEGGGAGSDGSTGATGSLGNGTGITMIENEQQAKTILELKDQLAQQNEIVKSLLEREKERVRPTVPSFLGSLVPSLHLPQPHSEGIQLTVNEHTSLLRTGTSGGGYGAIRTPSPGLPPVSFTPQHLQPQSPQSVQFPTYQQFHSQLPPHPFPSRASSASPSPPSLTPLSLPSNVSSASTLESAPNTSSSRSGGSNGRRGETTPNTPSSDSFVFSQPTKFPARE